MTPRGYSTPMRYEVTAGSKEQPCGVSDDLFGGPFHCVFPPGTYTPKNEQEEYSLDRLVELGYAKQVKPTKAKE